MPVEKFKDLTRFNEYTFISPYNNANILYYLTKIYDGDTADALIVHTARYLGRTKYVEKKDFSQSQAEGFVHRTHKWVLDKIFRRLEEEKIRSKYRGV